MRVEDLRKKPLADVLEDSADVISAVYPIKVDRAIQALRALEAEHREAGREDLAWEFQVAVGRLASAQLDMRYYPRMLRYWMCRCTEAEDELAELRDFSTQAKASA